MSEEWYELFALAMRYVFLLLGALIILRCVRWLRKDARIYRKEMRKLPDAGLVGEVVELPRGVAHPLPREGIIGSARSCDIRIKGPGIARRHALFIFVPGKGLRVTPCRGKVVYMADTKLCGSAYALHGTQVDIGDVSLRVRLFAGLSVPHPAQLSPDMQENWDKPMDDWGPSDDMEDSAVYPPFVPPKLDEQGQDTWAYAPYPAEQVRQVDPNALPWDESREEGGS